jgi:hypothetical protein
MSQFRLARPSGCYEAELEMNYPILGILKLVLIERLQVRGPVADEIPGVRLSLVLPVTSRAPDQAYPKHLGSVAGAAPDIVANLSDAT